MAERLRRHRLRAVHTDLLFVPSGDGASNGAVPRKRFVDASLVARFAGRPERAISDPDLGSVIDTDGVKDKDDKPLDPKLEECLRDTIETLGLPPMGPYPGRVKLKYSFRQDDDD